MPGSRRARGSARPGAVAAIVGLAVVGVDVLAEQRDLAHARGDQPRASATTAATGARTRRRAYRARRRRCRTCRSPPARTGRRTTPRAARRGRQVVELVLGRGTRCRPRARRARLGEQLRQAMVALRPDDDVDRGRARRMISAPSACATQPATTMRDRARRGALLLEHAQPAELGKDLFRRLFADVAGIEDDDVRVFDRVGRGDSPARPGSDSHAGGIVGVHLAAVGFDEGFLRKTPGLTV